MKEITIEDCFELKDKFDRYTKTAQQKEFAMLAFINFNLDDTLNHFKTIGKVDNQKEARAMFRCVLKVIGEDISEYSEV